MLYKDVVEQLFKLSLTPHVKLDLSVARALSSALMHPTIAYPCIHVAGTNGKGSVVTKIAKALELSGLKVGVYTSPHLFSFRERILVGEKMIEEEAVVRGMQKIFPLIEQVAPTSTFFEATTLLAFDYFRAEKVDVAVIETGLGGRLDATNIIEPLLSVITSISRDHTGALGESLEEIAREKAGIIKPEVPVVIGPKARNAAILARAKECSSPLFFSPEVRRFYDEENRAIARTALKLLEKHFRLTPAAVEKALQVRPSCRFEKVGPVLLDGAHNPDGFTRLFEAIDLFFPHRKLHVAIGMCRDKEYANCLKIVKKRAERILLLQANSPRAATIEELKQALVGYENWTYGETIKEAVQRAIDAQALLLVCGSFFLMKEARYALGDQAPQDSYDLSEKSSFSSASLPPDTSSNPL